MSARRNDARDARDARNAPDIDHGHARTYAPDMSAHLAGNGRYVDVQVRDGAPSMQAITGAARRVGGAGHTLRLIVTDRARYSSTVVYRFARTMSTDGAR